MCKLICPLMFCISHDATRSFLTNKYLLWMDKVCDWYYTGYRKIVSTIFIQYRKLLSLNVSISMHRPLQYRNRHTQKYLDCSSLETAPTTYDASLFSLRRLSLFHFSNSRPSCDVQTWPFKYRHHRRGRN